MNPLDIIDGLNELAGMVHANARAKGFWGPDRDGLTGDALAVALIHSEASELLEACRHGNPPSEHVPEFSAAEEELADIVIRCLDFARGRGFRIGEAVIAKHTFNLGRAAMHGGKAF